MLPLLVLLGTIAGAWYLLIVRPQKDQQTRHGRLVERLQVGDHVLTVGGIYGRVVVVEGPSVVLELAPGLTSRIATDGIARIVHAGEAALPTTTTDGAGMVDAASTPRQALDTDMHQHPHPDQQHAPQPQAFAAPQYVAPTQPYAPQSYAPPQPQQYAQQPQHAQPQQYAQQQYAPQPQYAPQQQPHHHVPQPQPQYHAPLQPQHVQPQPVAMAPIQLPAPPAPTVTMREPVGSSIPTFEPRPWGDVAPVNAQPQQAAPMPVYQPFAPAQAVPPVPHLQTPPAAYAQPEQVVQPQYAAHAQPAHVQPVAYAQPVAMQPPVVQQHAVSHPHAAAAAPAAMQQEVVAPAEERTRRHSRAPQGMGSSLRLDDPSIRDTMVRAREERGGLADEYRKLTAPLVAVDAPTAPPVEHAHSTHAQQPQLVGHDPNGMPLFATPGAPPAHVLAQYPAPAHPQPAHGMPRPVVVMPDGTDPALVSSSFQRRTPYAPDPALQPATARQPAHA